MELNFKRGSIYTRKSIGEICYPGKGRPYGGNWDTGYVSVENNLIIFMNIGIAGRTGQDFDNKFDGENNIITWYGKPNTHSKQPTFKNLLEGRTIPHFFARWDQKPEFTYLGVGSILHFKDEVYTKEGSTIELKLVCKDAKDIIGYSTPFGQTIEKPQNEFTTPLLKTAMISTASDESQSPISAFSSVVVTYLRHAGNNIKKSNLLSLIIAYYLSKYDRTAYEQLGDPSGTRTHEEIGKILGANPNTVKNMQDEFDILHDNSRVGWYQRPLRPSRVKVVKAFQNMTEEELRDVVMDILDNCSSSSTSPAEVPVVDFPKETNPKHASDKEPPASGNLISDNLKRFLSTNKIYSLDSLKNRSLSFLVPLRGYSAVIGKEISDLVGENNSNNDDKNQEEGQDVKFVNMSGDQLFKVSVSKPVSDSVIILSNRLWHIISRLGYTSHFLDFLTINDGELLNIKNFGKNCLAEIVQIRKKINIWKEKEVDSPLPEVGELPEELKDLRSRTLFLFVGALENLSINLLPRIMNSFTTLGDIYAQTDLLNARGIGRKAAEIIKTQIGQIHRDSFKDLKEKLIFQFSDAVLSSNIECTYFCRKFLETFGIGRLQEIDMLDEIDHKVSKMPEQTDLFHFTMYKRTKIHLLELRTLFYHEKTKRLTTRARSSKTYMNLAVDIDNFLNINLLNDVQKQIAMYRFGSGWINQYCVDRYNRGDTIPLEEIGKIFNITRERVRQHLSKISELFQLFYISDSNSYVEYFEAKILNNRAPIKFVDICENTGILGIAQSSGYYLSFLSEIFPSIPFHQNLKKFSRRFKKLKPNVDRIHALAEVPWKLTLDELLQNSQPEDRLLSLYALFVSDSLKIEDKDGISFVNRVRYQSLDLLHTLIQEVDRPVTLKEIQGFFETHSVSRPISSIRDMFFNPNPQSRSIFVRFDRDLWGYESHYSYSKNRWRAIQQDCRQELLNLGRQAEANYLFNKLLQSYPKLRSKYELVYILRSDNKITDLGFFTFSLIESGQNERVTVDDAILAIFKKDWHPIKGVELVKQVNQIRQSNWQPKDGNLLTRYPLGFYGLSSRDSENWKYLQNSIEFLESYVRSRQDDNTSLIDIMTELGIQKGLDECIELIAKSNQLIIIPSEGEQVIHHVYHKRWGKVKLLVSIIANHNRDMFLEELKIIAKNDIGRSLSKGQWKWLYNFEKDIRITKNGNGSYKYSGDIKLMEDHLPLLDEIEEYLNNNPQIIPLGELYNLVTERSDNLEDISEVDLLNLLTADNRFSILKGKMIGLI